MDQLELVIFGVLVAIAALAVLARVLEVPYPILLVLGGLALGFVPGIPRIELAPELVLLIFLPPLLYAASRVMTTCGSAPATVALALEVP